MTQKIINARTKNKRDTSANWTANDPVLLDGEIIIVDTAEGEVRTKIGDGIKTYTQLPFSDEKLRNLLNNHEGDSDIHVTAEEKAAWSESDVFIATYGTTTNAEIEAAYQAGKAIFLKVNDMNPRIPLGLRASSGDVFRFFLATSNIGITVYQCAKDAWSSSTTNTHASTHATGGSDPITPASIGAAAISTITEVTLPTASWSGSASPYTQTVTIAGTTTKSKVDIQMDATALGVLIDSGTSAIWIENNNGTLTAKALGEKPNANLSVQVTITEVTA